MITKKISKNIIAGLVCVTVLIPAVSFGQQASTTRTRPAMTGDFCASIDTTRDKFLASLQTRASAIEGKQSGRQGTMETGAAERKATLEVKRAEYDAAREERYDSLRSKATTDSQEAAVEEFATTVELLVDDRKEAIDDAIETFETAVEALKTSLDSVTGTLADEVESDINAIFDEAEAACGDDTTPAEIRAMISEGMAVMKAERTTERESYTFKTEFEALRAARLASEKAAIATFQASLKTATAELKTSFEAS